MTDDLLEVALSDPSAAWGRAEQILAAPTSAHRLSIAHQARGIVLRDAGDVTQALQELRTAVRHAKRVGPDRLADVKATLGVALFLAGRTVASLRQLDLAVETSRGVRARVLMRRSWVLMNLGRWEESRADTLAALSALGEEDPRWRARCLNNLGVAQQALGLLPEADRAYAQAEAIFRLEGLDEEAAHARNNRGSVAFVSGDLPRALAIYSEVRPELVRHGWLRLGLVIEHCDAYLAAGLTAEALATVEEYLADLSLPDSLTANLNLVRASIRLASGEYRAARRAAREARISFHRQQRDWLELRAHLVEVRARHALADRRGLVSTARELALNLSRMGADEAPIALLLAGRLARGTAREELWRAAAAYRDGHDALVRASGWLAQALLHELSHERSGILRTCGRGLAALDEHRGALGSAELRALSTAHGRELAQLALRHAAHDGRGLLRWSERWRATALAELPVTPDVHLTPELAALRDNGRRLAEARLGGAPTEQLEAERARLERAVRSLDHRRVGRKHVDDSQFNIEVLIADVGAGCLVELVDVDGTLHVIVVHNGKVRRRIAGSTEEALKLAAIARSAVRRAAHGRPYQPGDLGVRIQEVLLGSAVDLLPDGPVVISPTGRLHAVPWSMLPTLSDRAFSIVPSAAQWQRARAVSRPRRKKVLLLAAPGLGSGGSEVPKLARRHEGATVLRGKEATVEAALAGLDGASLAHVAAHGHFRQDSPLFSSLEMADGSLSVYELERLRRAPYRLVLSACESGVLAPVGADELLGLASALFSMGTAGLVCSIAEVNDDATAALMVDLHDYALAHPKVGLAGALLAARRAAQGDPTREATAAAFLALGI